MLVAVLYDVYASMALFVGRLFWRMQDLKNRTVAPREMIDI